MRAAGACGACGNGRISVQRANQQAAAAERSVHLEQKSASALGAYSVPKKGGWCGMLMKKARSSVCNGILGGWDSPV